MKSDSKEKCFELNFLKNKPKLFLKGREYYSLVTSFLYVTRVGIPIIIKIPFL